MPKAPIFFSAASSVLVLGALTFSTLCPPVARADTVSIVMPANAPPRLKFGAQQLKESLDAVGLDASIGQSRQIPGPRIYLNQPAKAGSESEGFSLALNKLDNYPVVMGEDDSGSLYGCLELASRIRAAGKLPILQNTVRGRPVMKLRGTCIGMQKTIILPGRKVYEYPYTPDLFPWFYDKGLWREYLDFLARNRFNTLYLWNGHPFASLVQLPDYPDAIEVTDEVFKKNVEMFRWITTECDQRGIWLVQMFYNIFLPKPLAEKHGVSTQLAAPTPLASDYTRKAIAEFVQQYPNVGLMVCLGEALQGTKNQIEWVTDTILPGVLDGMHAAELQEQPPVVIRTHAMDAEAIMPAAFQVYSNLFTMTKYNGESLTTYEPRGKVQATHLEMAKLGPHLVNIHILSNLEPFRYGTQRFIRKCLQASRDRLGASGIHLYPLAYWNWPYSPDITDSPLKQWERDWIWFEAWARYAWNPDIPEQEDRAYWISRLADFYGCNNNDAKHILDAYNDAGEVAPMLIRRFGITEGNRQTLALGMTIDQLVHPKNYNAYPELWESQAPPGERLEEFVEKEWNNARHTGETPVTVARDALRYSRRAVESAESVSARVKNNRDEFERLLNDLHCTRMMAENYAAKAESAMFVLRHRFSKECRDMERATAALAKSLASFEKLVSLTDKTYHFANSMQTGHRKIPFRGTAQGKAANFHWMQVLPLYKQELADMQTQVAELKSTDRDEAGSDDSILRWPQAKFKLISTYAETYEVVPGARSFIDRKYTLKELAPELRGLTGIRISHEEAMSGHYVPVVFEVDEPVHVLIGYFQSDRKIWLQVPNLDVASHADERGGVDVLLRNAASIDECPNLNVHAFLFEPGRHKLELIGKGSFVILGVVPQSSKLVARDVKIGAAR